MGIKKTIISRAMLQLYVVYSEIKYLLLLTAVQLVATGHMGVSQYDITEPDADIRIACVTVWGVNV